MAVDVKHRGGRAPPPESVATTGDRPVSYELESKPSGDCQRRWRRSQRRPHWTRASTSTSSACQVVKDPAGSPIAGEDCYSVQRPPHIGERHLRSKEGRCGGCWVLVWAVSSRHHHRCLLSKHKPCATHR
uniref:Uncharacterized protein n=1 Tax=Arundo donax TaxID=35708 RepID=A0A0A9CLW5_ARUDO